MSNSKPQQHLQSSDILSPGTTVDQQWQNLTRSANAAWRGGEKRAAYAYYESALSEAERLLTQAERGTGPAQAAAILVISHHNIAELAREDGQPELAMQHLQTPFEHLLSLACISSTPDALRQDCVANLKEATIALATHLQACGTPVAKISKLIRRAQFGTNAATAYRSARLS